MAAQWRATGDPSAVAASSGLAATVTLVEGTTFCISSPAGDVFDGTSMGLFVRDVRLLSRWGLRIDGARLEPLMVDSEGLYAATFVARGRPVGAGREAALLVTRERDLGAGLTERIRVRNVGLTAATLAIELDVGSDFADVFEVKEDRVAADQVHAEVRGGGIVLRRDHDGHSRGASIVGSCEPEAQGTVGDSGFSWSVPLEPRAEWTCLLQVHALINDEPLAAPRGAEELTAAGRFHTWRVAAPVVGSHDEDLADTFAACVNDLGALQITDPEHPGRRLVAAGVPWFTALFGRDSLLSSWMVLPVDMRLALGTLQALAEAQGMRVDDQTEEEPGKILHERRRGQAAALPMGSSGAYFGSVDATPLFVMLLAELRRWGQVPADVDALLPAADRALDWITTYGDRDGDGFVEYQRRSELGLFNQGWKDSPDCIVFADGRIAEPPIALAEVQGYVFGAYLARVHLARQAGDDELAEEWAQRALELRTAFNEAFWLPDRGYYAIGLDRDKRPIDGLASNMGHCLWTGIIDPARARSVVDHLMGPDLYSGWGIRTLAASMAAYNPMSYHAGSVWPHDNAIIAAGMSRYGFTAGAQRVARDLLECATTFGGRLPELFCGFDRHEFSRPVPYPNACAPQAWAAAAPFLLLRAMLRLEPTVPTGEVRLAPEVHPGYLPLTLTNVMLAGARMDIEVTKEGFSVANLPPGLRLVPEPRRATTGLLPDQW